VPHADLTLGLWLGLSAAAQPGPFQAYLLAQSIRNGAARTLPVAFVPLLSDPAVIAVVLAVLAQVPEGLLRALRILGGLVVLWLAWGTLRAALAPAAAAPAAHAPPRGVLRGAALNLTNPNAWIFWSFVGGPTLAAAFREAPARAALFLGGFYAALLAGGAALVLLAARAAALGPRFARGLGIVSGIALLGFGLVQLGRGLGG
jgi:threonine/homoserine/homoserine lactone efflux protein